MTRITRGLLLCTALLAGRGALAQPEGMLAGNLSSVGSDTLANLMALWAQDFSQHYPNVNLQIGPPAPLPRRPRWRRAPRSWAR